MNKVLEEFSGIGIVPVIALDSAEDAVPLARALIRGGLPCAEVTFRTDAAPEVIRRMAEHFPELLVGAGTVLTTEQAACAADAGAAFIVSPGFNPAVVEWCLNRGIPVFPGCASPSDMERALSMGLSVVKFFPAEANGGLAAIRAMAAPYRTLKFMPTGGISLHNMNRYLAFDKIIACGGSWMANSDFIRAKDWDGITAKTREAVDAMLGFSLKRIVIPARTETEAKTAADTLAALLGADSALTGGFAEIRTVSEERPAGQIVLGTNHVKRAVYHLTKRGFCPRTYRAAHGTDDTAPPAYTVCEIAGYTICLEQA